MLVPNQLVKVIINSRMLKYYRELGYDVKGKKPALIKIEDLSHGSNAQIQVICDFCKQPYYTGYNNYNNYHKKQSSYSHLDACKECSKYKQQLICLEKYGVDNVMKDPNILNKARETNLKHLGVEWPQQNLNVRKKREQTCIEIYGVPVACQNDQVKQNVINANIERYGVPFPVILESVQEKIKQTLIEKYGVDNISKLPEMREKAMKTMKENGVVNTSSQQIKIYEMIKQKYPYAELNYPFNTISMDIFVCINNINIDIEYDGSYWHQDQQRDIKRDKFLQSQGFKVLRIRSGHKLPTESELFAAIDELIRTNRIFKEIILPDWDKQYKINEGQEVSA